MKILVTGVAGFIGSHFAKHLLNEAEGDYQIIGLDSLTYSGNLANIAELTTNDSFNFIKGDINDYELVLKLLGGGVDAIVNFAAESHVDRSITNANDFITTNVNGTYTLLRAALKSELKKFVHISTDEVYGSINSGSWDELQPLQPNSPYSASKASADLLVRSFHQTYGINTSITRCSNNYGPNQYLEKLIPLTITNLIRGLKVPVYGDGQNRRDWLHVLDHCTAIELVLLRGASGAVYNIGGGVELSNLDLVSLILQELHLGDDLLSFVSDRLGHDKRYSVNYQKLNSELGYSPSVNFNDGIKETIRWYQSNEAWWKPLVKK